MPPPDESPTRTLQVALSAMAVVAVTVGLIVGGLVLYVSQRAGVDEVAAAQAKQAPATLSIPPYKRTPPAKVEADVKTYQPSPTPTVDLPTASPQQAPAQAGITLVASPQSVGPGERIDLSGFYGREGASLQVQRQQGSAWTDFPVSTTVGGGSFDTWIVTGQTGTAQFRVIDTATGTFSNPVTVTIG
jgi:hypothetical protein